MRHLSKDEYATRVLKWRFPPYLSLLLSLHASRLASDKHAVASSRPFLLARTRTGRGSGYLKQDQGTSASGHI